MDFGTALLSFFGIGKLKYGANSLSLAAAAVAISLLPIDYRADVALMLFIALSPIVCLLIYNARLSFVATSGVAIDKILILLLLSSFEFLSADLIRYFIMASVLILSLNVPFLNFDAKADKSSSVIIKILIVCVVVVFITVMLNLSIVLLKLSGRL